MQYLGPIVAALLTFAPNASAFDWTLVEAESSLTFKATQAGAPFTGRFTAFDAAISYDPAHPEAAHVRAEIDLLSATTGADERDSALKADTWFHTAAFPKAVFEASGFNPTKDGRFEANGMLSLKGITRPLTLQFSLDIEGDTAHAIGTVEIVRTNFNVGSGEFANGTWISKNVTIHIDLAARRSGTRGSAQ